MTENNNTVSEIMTANTGREKFRAGGRGFSDGYKMSVFELWYRVGKPNPKNLYNFVEADPISGNRPSVTILTSWVKNDFYEQAERLDIQVASQMEGQLIQEKVQMLKQHTDIGIRMQNMSMEYLEDHKEDLKVPNAVRMLVEGIRIERESRGIPQMLEKMVSRSDEELLKELQDIVTKTPVTIEPVEDE